MQELTNEKLDGVLELIKETQAVDSTDGEIELDMETLDPRTLYKLYRFVVLNESVQKLLSRSDSTKHKATKKKSRELLTEEQATKKMKQLEEKLGLYDSGSKKNAANAAGQSDGSAASDSDEESEVSDASDE